MTPRRALGALAALVVLHLLIALPARLDHLGWAAFARPAPELLVLVLGLLALGRTAAGSALRMAAVMTLGPMTVLKVADMAMQESLGRRFNPVADLPLIDASVRLIAGSLGVATAIAAVIAALVATGVILAALWWAMGKLRRAAPPRGWRIGAGAAALALAAALPVAPLPGWAQPLAYGYATDRVQLAGRTLTELRRFRLEAATDSLDGLDRPFALIDRDVLVIYLESYGRTSFDTEFFAEMHLDTLREAQGLLEDAGIAMASGFFTAPTHGGQSWLAHATLSNGLWIDNQVRYQAAIASGRRGLFHHAADAGFRTAAVMPAIVRPWPEASTMGFQRILAAPDLGYEGLPFNWVTMPDQFTMLAADRLLRDGSDPRRLFAQIALISSHAPWTPVPRLLDWDAITDGTEFDAMAQEGDPPNVLWRDRDRVRDHYRATIDYTLRTTVEYALRHADDPPLMVLVGDHQAASSIGLDERREVPVHVLGPAHLVERTAAWGLQPGLIPPEGSPAMGMETIRDLFIRNFSGPADVNPS